MLLNFLELQFIEGVQYKDTKGLIWEYSQNLVAFISKVPSDKKEGKYTYKKFHDVYSHKDLVDLRFKELINWSNVPVDTKIIVYNKGDRYNRHFAKYDVKTGLIHVWEDGKTSFTTNSTIPWENGEIFVDKGSEGCK